MFESQTIDDHVKAIKGALTPILPRKYGVLSKIVGLTYEATGIAAPVGSICSLINDYEECVKAEVVGFESEKLYLMPLSKSSGLRAGAKVYVSEERDSADVSSSLLGRVVNAHGDPIDGKEVLGIGQKRSLVSNPINPMDRTPISQVLDVGIKSINALFTIGCGQRIGLIAGSGVGKSVLLGMLTKFTSADVVVIGLIGERGREVKEFIESTLGEEGRKKAIVVAAPADESPLLRIRATHLAHLYAEYYRESGKNVLLLMDSLSRVAHAQREIGLAVGEPPTAKGYPPSVFSLLPKLIERTGTGRSAEGSITAIYTLLAEGDDLNDPIVDMARASLDGQIVLSRALADAAHYPAIDLMGSISRLMPTLGNPEEIDEANRFRRLWTLFQQNEDLINVGAYEKGSNPDLDIAISLRPHMEAFLRQGMNDRVDKESALAQMRVCMANESNE